MKSLALFLIIKLGLLVYAENAFDADDKIQNHNAFGYFKKIGIPAAKRMFEEESSQYIARIVGGEAADIVQHNYQAGLIVSIENYSGVGLCGGSLISGNRVATAAHCWFDGLHKGECMTVVLGSDKVFSGGTRIKTCEVYEHPDWTPIRASNDVAVIYLPTQVSFSDTISPVALPSKSEMKESFVGESVVASGFGRIGENIEVRDDQFLSKVNLIVISNEECSLTYPGIIRPSNICTSGNGTFGNVAICNGDSGGPLVLTRNGKRILIGITSFGYPGGCDLNYAHGYSRVSLFMDFFEGHISGSDAVVTKS